MNSVTSCGSISSLIGLRFSVPTVLSLLWSPTELTRVAKVSFECLVRTTVARSMLNLCRKVQSISLMAKTDVLKLCSMAVLRKVTIVLMRKDSRVMTGIVLRLALLTRRMTEA